MKRILSSVFLTLLLVSTAQAYTVQFDGAGSGVDANLKNIDNMQLNNQGEYVLIPGNGLVAGDIFTYQEISTGKFGETFTVNVAYGNDADLVTKHYYTNIYMDVTLDGTYYSDSNVQFTGGSAVMYLDNNSDYDFDGGDVSIASFKYNSALVSEMSGSLLGSPPNDLGMKIDLEFAFDTLNANYWGPEQEYLVGQKWLLSVVGGRVDQQQLWINPGTTDNLYIVRWQFPGAQMEFEAVPEPATMLLLGIGLVGLAGVSRRRFSKK